MKSDQEKEKRRKKFIQENKETFEIFFSFRLFFVLNKTHGTHNEKTTKKKTKKKSTKKKNPQKNKKKHEKKKGPFSPQTQNLYGFPIQRRKYQKTSKFDTFF